VVCLQVKLCDPHPSALEVRFSRRGAIQIYVYTFASSSLLNIVVLCDELDSLTYSGTVRQSYGGVGRNIADCLSRLGLVPLFISKVGQDVAGKAFVDQFKHMVCRRSVHDLYFSVDPQAAEF